MSVKYVYIIYIIIVTSDMHLGTVAMSCLADSFVEYAEAVPRH